MKKTLNVFGRILRARVKAKMFRHNESRHIKLVHFALTYKKSWVVKLRDRDGIRFIVICRNIDNFKSMNFATLHCIVIFMSQHTKLY